MLSKLAQQNGFMFIQWILFSFFSVDNADMLLEKSQKMIERFNYPWEMMPLLYVILKYANGDLEEATNQLSEGKYWSMPARHLRKEYMLADHVCNHENDSTVDYLNWHDI